MKKLVKIFLIIVFFISLALNALLMYYIKYIKEDKKCDEVIEKIDRLYGKQELGDLFKEYQTKAGLADGENVALWNVDKITYKGFFISDGRKVFKVEETFSCLEGVNCVNASNANIDDKYNVKASYIIAINDNLSTDIKFYILDESILEKNDFNPETEYDLK